MGPDFEVASAAAVPESSTFFMLIRVLMSFAFAASAFRRRSVSV
jgi:hypothetical protein